MARALLPFNTVPDRAITLRWFLAGAEEDAADTESEIRRRVAGGESVDLEVRMEVDPEVELAEEAGLPEETVIQGNLVLVTGFGAERRSYPATEEHLLGDFEGVSWRVRLDPATLAGDIVLRAALLLAEDRSVEERTGAAEEEQDGTDVEGPTRMGTILWEGQVGTMIQDEEFGFPVVEARLPAEDRDLPWKLDVADDPNLLLPVGMTLILNSERRDVWRGLLEQPRDTRVEEWFIGTFLEAVLLDYARREGEDPQDQVEGWRYGRWDLPWPTVWQEEEYLARVVMEVNAPTPGLVRERLSEAFLRCRRLAGKNVGRRGATK